MKQCGAPTALRIVLHFLTQRLRAGLTCDAPLAPEKKQIPLTAKMRWAQNEFIAWKFQNGTKNCLTLDNQMV
jgi:hypothetical protein